MKPALRLLLTSLICLPLWWAAPAVAELYVVVNAAAPHADIDRNRLAELYFGRARTFAGGGHALIIDRPDSGLRARFYQALGGMSLPQVNAYWARLSFTGRVLPPLVRRSDEEVLAVIAAEPNAIGYVARMPESGAVRVVLKLE